ncbi:MAG: diphosphomevalonate decarboxylase [Candidatus Micrarchaeota archaeon]|nr:diphosphomevalonate decarboxylase [Candidatus Micrarchaeota archaeon]
MEKSTWLATPNIAVVKYWGKRDSALNLPYNGSVSVTMDEAVSTRTTVEFDARLSHDLFCLNGKAARPEETVRVSRVLDAVRKKAGIKTRAKVHSENNFPTAAGIASSASGFAALACAAADAAGMRAGSASLSRFARMGSGSACRSVIGGFAEWKKGVKADGSDSYAVQIAPASHWQKLRNVIAITDAGRKLIGSDLGMQMTVQGSALYKERLRKMPALIRGMKHAILACDLPSFLSLAMKESSNMHAVMLDSTPPIVYLNDISYAIMRAVHEFNAQQGKVAAGYTFDAGPNAHVYTAERHAKAIARMLEGIKGVKKTIVCRPGNGPRRLPEKEALF